MGLANYFAIQKALSAGLRPKGWKVTQDHIDKIEDLFRPFTDGKNLIVTPRFNGSYISFRYCGLEMLQLTKGGAYRPTLEVRDHKIRRAKKIKSVQALDAVKALLGIIKPILTGVDIAETTKSDRDIPGFSFEHWLESLILADTDGGRKAREHLGINADLAKVVSQVPVIMRSLPGKTKRRANHIDLLSLNNDGKAVIVELKKDDDLDKALLELREYSNWFISEPGEFDPDRGNPQAMIKEHYMPSGPYEYSQKGLETVAVIVRSREPLERFLGNRVKLKIVELRGAWWRTKDGNPFGL